MFFVRVQTMAKNRIYDILDRHPEVVCQAPEASDSFGAAGMQWLSRIKLPIPDDTLLGSELELLKFLKGKISQSNGMVKKIAKGDTRARLLQSIPGIGPFFSVLILYEIDDIHRFRDEKKLFAYAGLVPRRTPQAARSTTAGLPRLEANGSGGRPLKQPRPRFGAIPNSALIIIVLG